MSGPLGDLPSELLAIYQAALAACDAGRLVEEGLRRDPPRGPVFLLGLGKPLARMALAARSVLGPQLQRGLVVVPEGPTAQIDPSLEFLIGSHPYPDARSASAGEALLAAAAGIPAGASILVLVAGGGSSLAVAPVEGLTLDDKIAVHRELLRAGLPIQIVNGVRGHLSRLKGGGLLRALARSPALSGSEPGSATRVRVEVLSDVADGELDPVASGPCAPDRTTFAECLDAVRGVSLPAPALRVLEEGEQRLRPETLKPGDPLARAIATQRLAGPRDLLAAAVVAAKERGLSVEADEQPWQISVADAVARMARWLAGPPTARLFAAVGEVQLTLPARPGTGGRAQQLTLAMASMLAKHRATLLVAGSDGRDGGSPYAGAIAGSDLELRAQRSGLDLSAALSRCDASSVISALHLGLPATPPVTNLTDLVLLAREG